MRTDRELVDLTLNSIDTIHHNFISLCFHIENLLKMGMITWSERNRLNDIIYSYIRKPYYPFEYIFKPNVMYNLKSTINTYWWKKGNKYYRKRYLKYLLKKL